MSDAIFGSDEACRELAADLTEAVGLLREIQFGDDETCTICKGGGLGFPHKPGCKLAAFLGRHT